jgi:hypothetical protein
VAGQQFSRSHGGPGGQCGVLGGDGHLAPRASACGSVM